MLNTNADDSTRTHVQLVNDTIVGHYRIIERIGAGGMGEVYLAEDSKLKRRVALKFLPIQFCSDAQLKVRFLREAEATARVSHPNVVVIHDIGEYRDRPYFAMEHVEGLTLRTMMQQGQLELVRILELIGGLCEGLQAAHSRGVIHRDIKPSNIVIDAYGRPKILDFGLAAIQGSEQLTRAGSTLGTIQYMAPEQVEGKSVDARADLFALGVVFYELIAGRAPFVRDSEAATLRAIIADSPEPLARYRTDVPDHLSNIVFRLLERDPARRYQAAADVQADLARLRTSSTSPSATPTFEEESIVVVPFENLGADPENEYFSDGLTEEIITDLGKIGPVRVISRKSSMQLKGTEKDIRGIGRDFGVRYVLTGSVRRAGENIRVNAELVEAANERQVWAERYSGTLKDVFDIQETVARSIAAALKVKLSFSGETALAHRSIKNPRAYDLYLRARKETENWTREGLNRAHELLGEALKLEPDSATLHAALGYNYYNYVNQGFHQEESVQKAKQCARQAFAVDPQSVDAIRLEGVISLSLTGEGYKGIQLLERALELSPQDTEAMWWLSLGYGFTGRNREAIEFADALIRIDPLPTMNQATLAWAYYQNGDFEKALRVIEAAYQREPTSALLQFSRAMIQLYAGKAEEAAGYIQIAASRPSIGLFDALVLIQVYALQGNRDKVDELITEEFLTSVRRDFQYPWHVAVAMTILGKYEQALDWLSVSIDNGYGNHRFLAEFDPYLEPLRSNPRFASLVERARAQALSPH